MSKRTFIKKVTKKVKSFCASCRKPMNPEFAVPTEDGLKHQSCFRRCL